MKGARNQRFATRPHCRHETDWPEKEDLDAKPYLHL